MVLKAIFSRSGHLFQFLFVLSICTGLGVFAGGTPVWAQGQQIVVPMTEAGWQSLNGEVVFESYRGKEAMRIISREEALSPKDLVFENGTIEFDVELRNSGFSFYFREQNEKEAESIYFRVNRIGNPSAPDAIQYTAVTNGVLLWDLHPHYQTAFPHVADAWNHVKIVVSGRQMLLYVNDMAHPVLQVPQLEGDTERGNIVFEGPSVIANLVVSPDAVEGLSPVAGFDDTANDIRYLRKWEVSEPFALPAGQEMASPNRIRLVGPYLPDEETTWSTIEAERRGLVNLSRRFGNNTARTAVWLKTTLFSARQMLRQLDLGYSDEVWVVLNGQLAYADKNIYLHPSMKEPDGRISVDNARVPLPLQAGENELLIGVANDFWGWGIIARLDDVSEVRTDARPALGYQHQSPMARSDGWQVDDLENVGMDLDIVGDAIAKVAFADETHDLGSLVVAKDGKLVVEQYFNTYRQETLHDIRSAGKTLTSTLVGIAIDQGLIKSTDEKVVDIFSDMRYANRGADKEVITVENLLNMSSGLDADVNNPASRGSEQYLVESGNFVQFVLDLPMAFEPGSRYVYNSAAAYLAGAVVEKRTGISLADYAAEHLFGPLNIEQFYWTHGPGKTTFGMGGLYLNGRDFAKLGQLFLDEGQWNGRQVVSKEWIEDTLVQRFEIQGNPLQSGYTRLWFVGQRAVGGQTYEVFYASGNGGNILAIVPALDLVVSLQQSGYGQGYPHFRAFSVIDKMIEACG